MTQYNPAASREVRPIVTLNLATSGRNRAYSGASSFSGHKATTAKATSMPIATSRKRCIATIHGVSARAIPMIAEQGGKISHCKALSGVSSCMGWKDSITIALAKNCGSLHDFQVEAMAAVGRPGPKKLLPEKLQARETPNDRRKLSESVFQGPFKSK